MRANRRRIYRRKRAAIRLAERRRHALERAVDTWLAMGITTVQAHLRGVENAAVVIGANLLPARPLVSFR